MFKRMTDETKSLVEKELSNGTRVAEIARKFGVKAGTIYKLKERTKVFKPKTVTRKNASATTTSSRPSEIDVLKAENLFLKTKIEFLSK
jgi:transposase-like protein